MRGRGQDENIGGRIHSRAPHVILVPPRPRETIVSPAGGGAASSVDLASPHSGADRFLREIEIAARSITRTSSRSSIRATRRWPCSSTSCRTSRASRSATRLDRERQLPVRRRRPHRARRSRRRSSYAHARDVVHRDIKPENILLHDGERAGRRLRHRARGGDAPATRASPAPGSSSARRRT